MKFKRIISVILVSALISINCISVYAVEDMSRSDWGYFWLENYCGVDTSQIKNTDYGSSFADIAKRYGTTTLDNSIKLVQNEINDPSYDAFYDYVTTQTNNTYVTTQNFSNYLIQKGQRTVETTGKKLWDMSGSSFFNSLYNKLFNNSGYKEQYETVTGQGGTYNDTENNINISVVPLGYTKYNSNTGRLDLPGMNYYSTDEFNAMVSYWSSGWSDLQTRSQFVDGSGVTYYQSPTGYYKGYAYSITIKQYTYYYFIGYGAGAAYGEPQPTFYNSNGKIGLSVSLGNGARVQNYVINFPWSDNASISTGQEVAQPYQIGGYFDENGNWHPLYTDPSLNPDGLVINPNGTVTLPTGQDVSIYIDPNEVSPEGQNDILKYWSDTPPDIDPSGYPWSDLTLSPDGNGGFNLSGLGEALKGLFDALLEGLKAVIGGIGDIIKEVFEGISEALENLLDLLGSIFSLDWTNDLDLSTIELPDFAGLFDDLINAFGTQIGLGDLT